MMPTDEPTDEPTEFPRPPAQRRQRRRWAPVVVVVAVLAAAGAASWWVTTQPSTPPDLAAVNPATTNVVAVANDAEFTFTAIRVAATSGTPFTVLSVAPEGTTGGAVSVADVILVTPVPDALSSVETTWPPKSVPAGVSQDPREFAITPATGEVAVVLRLASSGRGTIDVPSWTITLDVDGQRVTQSVSRRLVINPPAASTSDDANLPR